MIYGMTLIDKMKGGTQSFTDQVVKASIVNGEVVAALVIGISLMIVERIIFKMNPKEWREYFQYKENKRNHPLTLEELNGCLREILKGDNPNAVIHFDNLEVTERSLAEMNLNKSGKRSSKKQETIIKKLHDDSYEKNPLFCRYIFIAVLTFAFSGLLGFILPISYSRSRINPNMFSITTDIQTTEKK